MAPRRRRGAGSDSDRDDPAPEVNDGPKNRPPNTAFRQQRMRAWQCVLTPKLIVTVFSILAALYLGFGAYLTYLTYTVRDLTIDYTECSRNAPNGPLQLMPEELIKSHFSNSANPNFDPRQATWNRTEKEIGYQFKNGDLTQPSYTATRNVCTIEFNIPEPLQYPVTFYYHLENFYQNHRRYVQSFNAKQLLGEAVGLDVLNGSNCDPLSHDPTNGTKIIYPCGIIANSMFNDTFTSPVLLSVANSAAPEKVYEMKNNSGISWPGLKDLYGATKYNYDQITPPPNWNETYRLGWNASLPPPDLSQWEGFQNWMMLAAAPNFYKLYQRNDKDVMETGRYRIEIVDNFDTVVYSGRKSFVITTISAMGSRNQWPGIIFLIVGGICLILDVYFILSFFLWKPRKLGDPSYLSWNQPSAAGQPHATGAS
ncbi:hypothetical protein V8F33_001986 [Rhypophila sp. PSN 637]